MADTNQRIMRESLLQGGLSSALATLFAIEGAELFNALPPEQADRDRHQHGTALLDMLSDQLRRVQQQVDDLSAPPASLMGDR